ncbi:MAG: ribulose 1,5-bisphosphate carboxylase [Limnobacter sp.]|nr:ribulose 1,5-bisphosphate carboxylase [Limnobacter sp.]
MGPRLLATYRLRCAAADAPARAQALAIEQSVEMPPEAIGDPALRARVLGTVEALETDPADPDATLATLSLASETVGADPVQLMNMLFGNCALQPDVTLLDARLPEALLAALPGPRFGAAGLREATGSGEGLRPLGCTALKPQGLAPEDLARLAYAFARAGIDVIKDDHGIADQAAAPFDRRVAEVQRAVDRANREKAGSHDPLLAGHRSLYAPHVSGTPARVARQLEAMRNEGVGAALACPMLMGVGTFVESLRMRAGVPIIAHPAFAGGQIAPSLLLGRLFRLFGADATIFPNWGGRFSFTREECLAIAAAAREPLGPHLPIMPVPAGGMRVERCGEMIAAFGLDTMLLIGGDLLSAGPAMPARAAAFARALHEAAGGIGERAAAAHAQPLPIRSPSR